MKIKHFTEDRDPKVNEKILSELNFIKEFLLKNLANPEAFILIGSFGRSEGKMIIEERIQIANDYDVMVITEESVPKYEARRLSHEIKKELGVPVDLIFEKKSNLKELPPTIRNFDAKYGHFVFYGDDEILAEMPAYSPKDIPLREGQYLMRNRLICLLESFSLDFVERSLSNSEKIFLLAQSSKVVLAASDALLLSKGLYHVSYREKFNRFSQEFTHDKKTVELVETATEIKLSQSQSAVDTILYWQQAKNFLLHTLDKLPPIRNECSLIRRIFRYLRGEGNLDCLKQKIEGAEINLLRIIQDDFAAPPHWEEERKKIVEQWYKYLH